MEFTDRQKEIIRELHSFEKVCSLVNFLDEKGIVNTVASSPKDEGAITVQLKDLEAKSYFCDIILVADFLVRNQIIGSNNMESKINVFVLNEPSVKFKLNTKLTMASKSLWDLIFSPTLELEEFIHNKYRTKDEITLEAEKKRGEKSLFWTRFAVIITALGMVISAYFNYASLQITKNNSHVLLDTVKVMYYNPPKDSSKLK